ncbi:hypothetical protein Taro_009002 [Colocasia esculenta]|uniref:SOUL heme-binding family protein n=1 Tax=Colocasia esculenta TaxID=4460 RepID=A0A843U3K4_COLES|nr:hypothetical protein [Colocasia esculenta]
MGLVFGKIDVETPKYEVLHTCPDYEIRKYASSVVAQVTYDPAQMRGDRDGGFMVLANYIGALGNPQNTRSAEKIAMTAPVVTTNGPTAAAGSEKIAMTAPVITTATASAPGAPEEIAMTAPVVTSDREGMVTMQFVLPSKYRKAEEAPTPLDGRVVIREEGERTYGVVRFSGVATEKVVEEKVEKLRRSLERDGHQVAGQFLLGRYNPPWTLPPCRTNEVMLPIE